MPADLKYIFLITCLFVSTGVLPAYDQEDALKKSMERGKKLYAANCATCHMVDGKGIKNVFPPLAGSDYLMDDLDRSIHQILNGVSVEMTVNGVT